MTSDVSTVPGPETAAFQGKQVDGATYVTGLTEDWGDSSTVSSYLARCQVDTPPRVVRAIWQHIRRLRPGQIGKVVDLGAGDGRFAHYGTYRSYVGYEIDKERSASAQLPQNAKLLNACAFSEFPPNADICVGNPPFVRFQQIPSAWRRDVHNIVRHRTGVSLSGLANAWQYFFLNALACLKTDGLSALIVPFEWVSRPSAKALREYIRQQRWNVHVYRLPDAEFASVLTTASISIVDKSTCEGKWNLFETLTNGRDRRLESATGTREKVLSYLPAVDMPAKHAIAKRGLSPGTQKVLTLTEPHRHDLRLSPGRDVVPCVSTLRHLPATIDDLDQNEFFNHYVSQGKRCWLIRTDNETSPELREYLDSVPESARQTRTCLSRPYWWRFKMPDVPAMLFAQGFRGRFPKVVKNTVAAYAVGGVCGIYNATDTQIAELSSRFGGMDLRQHVVPYSSGFYKVEINQINALLAIPPTLRAT